MTCLHGPLECNVRPADFVDTGSGALPASAVLPPTAVDCCRRMLDRVAAVHGSQESDEPCINMKSLMVHAIGQPCIS